MPDLPRILVIDDQFGRCGLGKSFESAVSGDIMAAYRADRQNLCRNYGIRDLTGDSEAIAEKEALCDALFCPAQRWDSERKHIDNGLNLAIDAVQSGWPFPDGSRWALVLLDLAFVQGVLDVFGDPQERSFFGRDAILPELKRRFGDDLPIIVLSSTPKEEHNEAVRRAGALDFIQRIPNSTAQEGASQSTLAEMLLLHGLMTDAEGQVIGHSLAMLKMLRQARRAANRARTILLHGEIGTGKNLLARYIHNTSSRRDHPFEVFNAANRSADLQADELFGHWKGAFTGAGSDTAGIWERCNGGTVLIDEVADLDLSVQQKLMAPIEERQVSRMGGSQTDRQTTPVDVLTILATNRDLGTLAENGSIKKDFLSRINATVIDIPPLRDRKEDIPQLIALLTAKLKHPTTLLPDAIEVLCAADWKDDNVRGLRRTIEQLAVSHPGQVVTARDIPTLTEKISTTGMGNPVAGSAQFEEVSRFLQALTLMPDACTREECRVMAATLGGAFPGLVAHTLAWSLQLCGNVTQAARFLSGNPAMTTTDAKQFVKKLLKLDVKTQSVLKAFEKHAEAGMPIVRQMLQEQTDD